MKIINRLLRKYNDNNNILVISGYPKRGEKYSQGVCAVSSFTKNSLLALAKNNPDRKIVVLTVSLNDKEDIYEENNMLIVRCFRRNQPLSYCSLLKKIVLFKNVRNVLVEFEFSSFGNLPMTALLIPLLFAIRLLNKKVFLVMHQVLLDLKKINGHIGMSSKSLYLSVLNFGLNWFYKTIAFPTEKVVVLEKEFKMRLQKLVNPKKIVVIPHGVDKNLEFADRYKSRKALGFNKNDFVVLYFGFLTWYKGVDFLIKAFKHTANLKGKNIKILIAGGPSFTQGDKAHYQAFLKRVEKAAKSSAHMQITGFVQEKNISRIFTASDLVALPYRTYMSSSGPFSLTLSHGKPFILSEKLKNLTKTEDFKNVLSLTGISQKDFIFNFSEKSLRDMVVKSIEKNQREKLSKLSYLLSEKRSFDNLALNYETLLSTDLNFGINPTMLSLAR